MEQLSTTQPAGGGLATSVRLADLTDAAELAALVNRAYAVEEFFIAGERTNPDEIRQLLSSGRAGQFLVLEDRAGIAAAVYIEQRPERASGYIGLLSVDPRLQGQGIGTRLVRIAEAVLQAFGATVAELRVVNLREELGRWYRGLGYREVRTAPFTSSALKRPAHFVEMQRSLV